MLDKMRTATDTNLNIPCICQTHTISSRDSFRKSKSTSRTNRYSGMINTGTYSSCVSIKSSNLDIHIKYLNYFNRLLIELSSIKNNCKTDSKKKKKYIELSKHLAVLIFDLLDKYVKFNSYK